jgi:hypothetical protein
MLRFIFRKFQEPFRGARANPFIRLAMRGRRSRARGYLKGLVRNMCQLSGRPIHCRDTRMSAGNSSESQLTL